jgi:hypothetical protein
VDKLQENTNKNGNFFNEALEPNYMGVSSKGSTKLERSFGGKLELEFDRPFFRRSLIYTTIIHC